ncbi:RluA family pseudouridine synthase [Sneathiella sp.]|jgi:tRNA pseudouridine32 synthase/23S rRNA pseudouridine746 synthase|uniref:RluA family pseudouridine synthase n=1 Tax=Sneathiella sp. TaxID=1964365 RepID=UPI0039E37B7E
MNTYSPPPDHTIPILYEDDFLIVANKPSGLLSVPGRGEDKQDCLISRVQRTHPTALIVHRLDMETSGLIMLALSPEIHKALSISFQSRTINKQYSAIVDGHPEHSEGTIDLPLIADWPNRPRQKVNFDVGKPSVTHWKLVEKIKGNSSRIELTPITGRSHQLRVHMLSIGHPILGDSLYGGQDSQQKASRLLLHACQLGFPHPVKKQPIMVSDRAPF